MNYPLRSIAFVAELIHPPMRHGAENLQRVHSAAFNDEDCSYRNFQLLPAGAQLANPMKKPNVLSVCTLLPDRIQVREELTGIGRDEFRTRLLRLVRIAVNNLGIQALVARQFVVRSLINPRTSHDSREFLGRAVMGLEAERFKDFGGAPGLIGLRLTLKAPEGEEGLFNVRVESYAQDARSLFLECVGTFRAPLNVAGDGADDLGGEFDRVYAYVRDRVVPFVARFDHAP